MVLAPPPLAAPLRRAVGFPAILRWWHLLSLDAPSVAALWSWSIGRAIHLHLPPSSPLLLALGTWLVYVADRILDGLPASAPARLRERHLFYARNRKTILAAAAAVGSLLLWLIVTRMSPAARREDTELFAVALVYFCLIHLIGRFRRSGPNDPGIERWVPKEAAVAVVFAAAVAVPAWSRLPGERALLLPLISIFALLCWLNCVAIEKWETTRLNLAPLHASTRWTAHHLRPASSVISVAAVLAALQSLRAGSPAPMTALYAACAISAALFPVLDGSPLDSSQRRIAADAALLTPLLFIFVLR
ncbi:MAG TPA: hypothetical protein VMB19_11635 [Silvibacterium sp.]|nr:hypothetical protein [Silvibacterium sp.]